MTNANANANGAGEPVDRHGEGTQAAAPEALALPSGMALGGAGLAVAWSGPLGAAVAWMASETALAADWAHHVGRDRPGFGRPQVAFAGADSLVAAWCEDDGAHAAVLARSDGTPVVGSFAAFPRARQVAIATRGGATLLAAVDDEGVVARLAASPAELPRAAPFRIVSQRGLDALLAASELGDGWLVAYALASEELFGLCTLEPGTGARAPRARDVRHRLRGRPVALHASGAGAQAAIALGYDGDARSRIDVAMVASDGSFRERPHPAVEELGGAFAAPHVHWMESAFVVSAVEIGSSRLHLGTRGRHHATSLARVPADVAIGFWAERVVACAVRQQDEATTLLRSSCDRRGDGASRARLPVAPADTALRLARSRTRRALVEAGAWLGSGYRSGSSALEVEPERLELALRRSEASARLRVSPDGDGWRVELAAWRGARDDGPAPSRSIVRLLRWLGSKLSADARQASGGATTWAEALATVLAARVERVDWVPDAYAAALRVERLPSSEGLARALQRALELGGSHAGAGGPGPGPDASPGPPAR